MNWWKQAVSAKERGMPMNPDQRDITSRVMIDLSVPQITNLVRKGALRGIWDGKNTYWWQGAFYIHDQVAQALNIERYTSMRFWHGKRRGDLTPIVSFESTGELGNPPVVQQYERIAQTVTQELNRYQYGEV